MRAALATAVAAFCAARGLTPEDAKLVWNNVRLQDYNDFDHPDRIMTILDELINELRSGRNVDARSNNHESTITENLKIYENELKDESLTITRRDRKLLRSKLK